MSRHREEPPGPAFGGPDDRLCEEAIQGVIRGPGLLRFWARPPRGQALLVTLNTRP
jgi:hypothetical protein